MWVRVLAVVFVATSIGGGTVGLTSQQQPLEGSVALGEEASSCSRLIAQLKAQHAAEIAALKAKLATLSRLSGETKAAIYGELSAIHACRSDKAGKCLRPAKAQASEEFEKIKTTIAHHLERNGIHRPGQRLLLGSRDKGTVGCKCPPLTRRITFRGTGSGCWAKYRCIDDVKPPWLAHCGGVTNHSHGCIESCSAVCRKQHLCGKRHYVSCDLLS